MSQGSHRRAADAQLSAANNLQVLPKDLTGRQVRDTMETWAGSLGVHCDFCHTADPKNVGPNGRPRMNFADDSKPDKQIARIMYSMTQQMNKDYVSKAMDLDKDGMGKPVTCGTCHRGHEMPEEFVIPREEHRVVRAEARNAAAGSRRDTGAELALGRHEFVIALWPVRRVARARRRLVY